MRNATTLSKSDVKKFIVTSIRWDKESDDEVIDVDLPETVEVILDIADIVGLSTDEVNDLVIDGLTEKFCFLIEGCNVAEASE